MRHHPKAWGTPSSYNHFAAAPRKSLKHGMELILGIRKPRILIHEELYRLTGNKEQRAKAMALYLDLYKKTARVAYKQRRDNLKKIKR